MQTVKTAGKQLQERRESLMLQAKTVAAMLGVSPQAVSAWENDVNPPGRMMVGALDRLYGGDGFVLGLFGITRPESTIDDVMAAVEQVRDAVRLCYTVLAQLAEREGVEPPTPATRSSDPRPVNAGRRKDDQL